MQALHMKGSAVFFPFLLSVFLYVLIVFSIFLYLQSDQRIIKKYSSKKDNFLEVAIVKKQEIKQKPQIKKPNQQPQVKPKKPQPQFKIPEIPKQEPMQKKLPKIEVKDLFGKIKIKENKKPKVVKSTKTQKSRLKPKKKKDNKATKIAKSLQIQSTQNLSKTSSAGEYDEFRGKIQETLLRYWNEMEDTGVEADAFVKINIDKNGNFSYTIVNLSYNGFFNERLKDFLEQMREVKFPENTQNIDLETIKFSNKWSE
ncbi:MAG: hypothetical protein CR967_01960 [Proteobacteria bacterium]|nr:MAG: hypothetical protein CR967_01960 [Pseudomonadota bacterium]